MSILTLEERKQVAVQEQIPHKDSGTPVPLDIFDRASQLISSAKKVFDAKPDLVQYDLTNADICQKLLKDTGCNEEECQGNDVTQRLWERPQHIFQHLLSYCIAYQETDLAKHSHGFDGSCKWCTGGIMNNYQRGAYTIALRAWRLAEIKRKEEEAKEVQDTPPVF